MSSLIIDVLGSFLPIHDQIEHIICVFLPVSREEWHNVASFAFLLKAWPLLRRYFSIAIKFLFATDKVRLAPLFEHKLLHLTILDSVINLRVVIVQSENLVCQSTCIT